MPLSATNTTDSASKEAAGDAVKTCDEDKQSSAKVPADPRVRKRMIANRKERRRTRNLNSAFSLLRHRIPNIPSDTKLPKIKILKMASGYIQYLEDMLQKQSGKLTVESFQESEFFDDEECEDSPVEVLPTYEEAIGQELVGRGRMDSDNPAWNSLNTQPLSHFNITFED